MVAMIIEIIIIEESGNALCLLTEDALVVACCIHIKHSYNYTSYFKYTNYSTRTALVIMPPLFMFGLTSETTINSTVRNSQNRKQHAKEINQWVDSTSYIDPVGATRSTQETKLMLDKMTMEEQQTRLSSLYAKSVEDSGMRIVEGSSLGPHHILANFWQEHPFKVLLGIGAPTVAMIFLQQQKTNKTALQMQIMQTRVLGQTSMIFFLLSIMGFKEYMDRNGKFITQTEADNMVMEMQRTREELFNRLGVTTPTPGQEGSLQVKKPISTAFQVDRNGKVVRIKEVNK